ncbi:MAG: molybdopterin-dependent oxidoreductase [Candidatus Aminicenantales bacterium]
MSIKRRDFLKITGGLSLGLPLIGCSVHRLSTSESSWFAALESWVPTVCGACPAGCGILVRVIDDRAVKIEGNPLHPLNRGKVCAKGQAGLQFLYHPQRIRTPLIRTGRRGSEKWEPVEWEEALSIVAEKLKEIRNKGKPHTVVYLGGNSETSSDELVSRFFKVYGTPNCIRIDDWSTLRRAYHLTQGIDDLLAYDIANTKYILSFGADFLNNWPTSIENQRVYGVKRAKREIKIVQVEPRFSLCASRADRWIPIRPGSEGLLALAIASIIIKERIYNKKYIERFSVYYEDFRDFIVEEIRAEYVSELTGVPLKTIIETAKEFATSKPAVAVADYQFSFHPRGLFNVLAVHYLNALAGNIDTPGGLLRQRKAPLLDFTPASMDKIAQSGLSQPTIDGRQGSEINKKPLQMKNLIHNLANRKPYEVNCLFFHGERSLPSAPSSVKIKEAFEKIPFKVSFSPFFDEASKDADIILPDTTYFEKWQERRISSLSKIPIVGIGKPVIKPLYQSRPFEEVMLALARKISISFSQNFPWSSFKEVIFSRLEGLFNSKRGNIFTSIYEEEQLRFLEERGWWIPQHTNLQDFTQDLLKKGGWHDPYYHFYERGYIYQNKSRKFEFIKLKREEVFTPSTDDENYPYLLYLFELPFGSTDYGAHLPFYQETVGFRFNSRWNIWAEINPETAKKLHIKDNDLIWVESPYGKIKAVAKVSQGIMPDVIGIPLGKEEDPLGEHKGRKENNPLVLVGDTYNEQTGRYSRTSTRVKITKGRR